MSQKEAIAALATLTPSECRVLYWLCRGLHRTEIATKLVVTERTVYFHLGNIYGKLGLTELRRSQRQLILGQLFCPLLLDEVRDPDSDCGSVGSRSETSVPTPTERSLVLVRQDEEAGIIPISGDLLPGGSRRSGGRAPNEPVQGPTEPRPGRRPSWILPVVGVLLAIVVVLLALNLIGSRDRGGQGTPVASQPTQQPKEPRPASSPVATAGQVALPTYTRYPTQTDAPTYTPYPSATRQPRAADTRVPAQVSEPTRIPHTATWTAQPPPTAPANTPSDAVLELGEWWRQDGVWLRLQALDLEENGFIPVILELWNQTEDALLFGWTEERNFLLEDNLGHKYRRYSYYFGEEERVRVERGERKKLVMAQSVTMKYKDEAYFNAAVTDLYLTVMDLSRIPRAKWHIRVPK